MDIPSLKTILTGLAAGTLTYPAAKYLFLFLESNGYLSHLSSAAKRWLALALAFLLAGLGLAGSYYLYGLPVTPESVWQAGAAAFLASQMVHAEMKRRRKQAGKGSPTSLPR